MRTTSLRLSQEQEERLVSHCLERVTALQKENKGRIDQDKLSWRQYENEHKEKQKAKLAGESENIVLPLCALIVDRFACRAKKQIFGTPPFFHVDAIGQKDRQEAKQIDAYALQKLGRKGELADELTAALWSFYIQRATVFKVVWTRDESHWVDFNDRILYDKTDDKPVMVMGSDSVPQPVAESHAEWTENEAEPGVRRLKTDPTLKFDESKHEYRQPGKGVPKVLQKYVGAKAVILDYDAFLAPLSAKSLQEAEFVAEVYDQELPWVQDRFVERPWLKWDGYKEGTSGYDSSPKSKTERAEEASKAEPNAKDDSSAKIGFYECWLRWDVLENGTPLDFMVIIDKEGRKAVYYEYTANICPDYERPYVSVSVCAARNRWCADKSLVEKIRPFNRYMDKQFNRESKRNEINANPIGGVDPSAVKDQPTNIDMGIRAGLHELMKGKKITDFIQFAEVPELDTKTHELIEYIMSLVQLWLGISNLSQGDYSDTPENQTATGITTMMRESNNLGEHWIFVIARGFERIITKLLELQIDNMDVQEAIRYLEGDVESLVTVTRDRINELELHVRVAVAESDTQQKIITNQQAIAVVTQYMATPPQMQSLVRPLYETILRNLGIPDTDRLLPAPPQMQPVPIDGMPAADQPQQGGAPGPAPAAQPEGQGVAA